MSQTKFNWIDQSWFDTEEVVAEYDAKTLFLALITADKGKEDVVRLYGDDFYRMFGRKLSFEKHGLPLLQAKAIIDAGGELLVKRFVADDATLSNVIIVAKVEKKSTQRTNPEGELLYVDASTGEETTTSEGNLPLNDDSAVIKYELQSAENAKSVDDVYDAAAALLNEEDGVFPILVVADIGRNADLKRIAIRPDYDTSKSLGYMIYTLYEYENTVNEEKINAIFNPSVIYKNKYYTPTRNSMEELVLDVVPGAYEAYAKKVAEFSGIDYDTLINMDLIFGKNLKGVALDNLTIDAEGADLSYQYGIELKNGSDGTTFGDTPKTSPALATAMVDFINNNEEIYDRDVHKIAMVVDADYPLSVKEALVNFVNFREDCVFLRDFGMDVFKFSDAMEVYTKYTTSRFVSDYITTYQIFDPYTDRRIRVGMLHGMIPAIIEHFQTSPATPLAGIVNGFTITEAIEGTVNYIPRETPAVNQKDELEDAHINYATYYEYGGPLVVDSLFTSQERMSQLSYVNNVIAIQEVMRAVRTECPKNRFRFSTTDDFTEYQEAVNTVLANFKSSFKTLQLVYTEDKLKVAQKIFYAAIKFQFHNWADTEIFDLYALPSDDEIE